MQVPARHSMDGFPCGGTGALLKWLNTSAVVAALNVPSGATFFLTDNGVTLTPAPTLPPSVGWA